MNLSTSTGDLDLDELLGLATLPAPAWPPVGFTPPAWDHPLNSWTYELLQHGKRLAADVLHFPQAITVQEIRHCGVAHRVVLVGVRMTTRLERSPMPLDLRTAAGQTWGGGRVDVDGEDLLARPDRWARGDGGRGAGVIAFDRAAVGLRATTVTAVTAADGMRVARYTVDQEGCPVPRSLEEWIVDGGEVRRAR